jgi:hypothetical protein
MLAGCILAASVHADTQPVWIHQWSDIAVYEKTQSNLVGKWTQHTGLQFTLVKWGNWKAQYAIANDPTYPLNWKKKPAFTNSLQVQYTVHPDRYQPAVYTKIKNDFLGTWQEETGVTAHVASYKLNYMSAGLGYVFKCPYKSDAKPGWAAYFSFVFPL